MLKKLIITAAAMLLMFGTAANAQYYQDRYYDRKNAVLKDGTAYVGAYWDDWFYMDCEGKEKVQRFHLRETAETDDENSEYQGYVIEGKVYSHPTEENRAMLNGIMDSFKPYI